MSIEANSVSPKAAGRPGLSFEAYEQAYHELTGNDGIPPSQRQLRKYLGTGSNTTLSGYRRRIADERAIDEKPPESGSLDAELLATVNRLAAQIALDEAQVAEDRVDEIQRDAESRIHIAEATMEKRLQDTALLEHRAKQAEEELEKLRVIVADKDVAINSANDVHQQLKTEHATLNQSYADVSRRVSAQSRKLSEQEEALESSRSVNQSAAEKFELEIASLKKELAGSQAKNATLTEKAAGLHVQLNDHIKQTEIQNSQQQKLESRLDQVIDARDAASAQVDQVRTEWDLAKQKMNVLHSTIDTDRRLHNAAVEQYQSQINDQKLIFQQLQDTVTALTKISGAQDEM